MAVKELSAREARILAVLQAEERYGLQIRDGCKDLFDESVPLGSLYVTLDRMEASGLVKSRMGDPSPEHGGNRRRFYQITGHGRQAFSRYKEVAATILGVSHA